jgi:hypothetical protein
VFGRRTAGWTFALEQFARWFCLEAGVKSLGLSQRATVDTMNTVVSTDECREASRNLVSDLRDSYNIAMASEVFTPEFPSRVGPSHKTEALEVRARSFEEFFCASYLARSTEVFSFLAEMLDEENRMAICTKENLPVIWRNQFLPSSVAPESIRLSQ